MTNAINGQSGTSTFTTMTTTRELIEYRRQLDSGAAYTAAGIPVSQRGLDFVIGGKRRVYPATNVIPGRGDSMTCKSARLTRWSKR